MIPGAMRLTPLRLLAGSLFWCVLLGQGQPLPTAPLSVGVPPPLPPAVKSPIDFFRELLVAQPADRATLLAGKSAEQRKVLDASLRAYEALTPEERELRLRTMDLRFHLNSLLRLASGNRTEWLKLMPDKDRPLVEARLKVWDGFSPEDQRELLENERIMRLIEGVAAGRLRRDIPLTVQTSNQVRQIERQLIRWQTLPEARRRQIQQNLTSIFELTDAETARQKLQPLPLTPEEWHLMEQTLAQFQKLSPMQRDLCIRNFKKFADLSPAQRRQFLVSAQEWQKMKPEDRNTWRKLVSKVPPLPPLPPRPIRAPPLPAHLAPPATVQLTNVN